MCLFCMTVFLFFFFFKQKTAYEMRISDWSSDVCSSDLDREVARVSTPLLSSAAGRAAANRKLLQTCRNFQPDLVLLGHCKIIENRTLDALRASCPGQRIAYRNVDTLTAEKNRHRARDRKRVV